MGNISEKWEKIFETPVPSAIGLDWFLQRLASKQTNSNSKVGSSLYLEKELHSLREQLIMKDETNCLKRQLGRPRLLRSDLLSCDPDFD
jgi:hypothetical protein